MTTTILRILYGPATPFVGRPELAYLMAVIFGSLALAVLVLQLAGTKPRILLLVLSLVAALLWGVFGMNEQLAQQQGWNIRVDVFFLWPAVLIVSLTTAGLGIRSIIAQISRQGNVGQTTSGQKQI